jgi:hypothetical protein
MGGQSESGASGAEGGGSGQRGSHVGNAVGRAARQARKTWNAGKAAAGGGAVTVLYLQNDKQRRMLQHARTDWAARHKVAWIWDRVAPCFRLARDTGHCLVYVFASSSLGRATAKGFSRYVARCLLGTDVP